jgi:hypothetical protein
LFSYSNEKGVETFMLSAADQLEMEVTDRVTARVTASVTVSVTVKHIINILNSKFGTLSQHLETKIKSINDINELEILHNEAVIANDIDTFSQKLLKRN